MLHISPEQMGRVAALRRSDQLLELLRKAFPATPPEDSPALRQVLAQLVERCPGHALFQERDIGRFVCVAYQLGPDFDTRFPAAGAILADGSRPAEERLTLLECWSDAMLRALDGAG